MPQSAESLALQENKKRGLPLHQTTPAAEVPHLSVESYLYLILSSSRIDTLQQVTES